jgi:hypothetical protein
MNGGLVKSSMGLCTVLISAALMSSVVNAADQKPDQNTYALQYDFGTASDLVVEPKWQNVPDDASAILKHIATDLGRRRCSRTSAKNGRPTITSELICRGLNTCSPRIQIG